MYEKTNQQERGSDIPTTMNQPELHRIIQLLQDAIDYCDNVVYETRERLQTLKRVDVPSQKGSEVKDIPPQSVLEELNRLIYRLRNINDKAENNLNHLKEIV